MVYPEGAQPIASDSAEKYLFRQNLLNSAKNKNNRYFIEWFAIKYLIRYLYERFGKKYLIRDVFHHQCTHRQKTLISAENTRCTASVNIA